MRWLREESGADIVPLAQGIDALAHGEGRRTAVAVTFDDGFMDVLTVAMPVLARHAIPFTVFVVGAYLDAPPARGLYMDRAAVRDLAQAPGASIGAHGFSHRPLTRLSDQALDDDLGKSRDAVLAVAPAGPVIVSYPYGAADGRVARHAEAAGFHAGLTSVVGVNTAASPRFRIRRTEILSGDDLEAYTRKLRGDYDWYRFRQQVYWPVPEL
jgi:peptidoglycan/xylan/chitin deacetylase (PgdA/CDA1 family)